MVKHAAVTLGVLGRYYSARHTLGQYRSACVTATYDIPLPNDSLLNETDNALEYALQATIRLHAGLQYGVSDKKEAGVPLFRQIRTFDREDVLEVIDSQDVNGNDGKAGNKTDDALSKLLESGHSALWFENKPAWKVVVVKRTSNCKSGPSLWLDISFFAHHAITDGLSGVAFHASLMRNLKLGTPMLAEWPLELNEVQSPPPTIEQGVDCLSCNCTICTTPDKSDEPVWGGGPISTAPTVNYESRVRIVMIPAAPFSSLLRKCKQANVTVTGLLHAIICSSLINSIEEDVPGLRAVTPFSTRRHTGASDAEIVNHVSYLTSYVSRDDLQKFRDCQCGSDTEEQHIIDLARRFSNEVASKVKEFPHGSMATKLSQVQDLLHECQSQGGTERRYAYELSNLGLVSSVCPPEGSGIKLDRLVFTQCGFVAGPALGFNCVSTKGGDFAISITWQRGIVAESVVEDVAQELETRLGTQFARGREPGRDLAPPMFAAAASWLRSRQHSMAPGTESEPVREWIVLIPDVEGSLETRMRVRKTHIEEMIKHIDSGLFQMGGGTLAENTVDGSAIIARAKSEADIMSVLKTDIYARSGVWDLDKIQFIPVYVKVDYAAFNPTDRLALDVNAFGDDAVLGCDFSGEVVDVHSTVTKLKPGDSIAGFVWGGEIKGLGAYSTYTIADERLSFKIPENINPAEASSVPLAANTAWLALFSDDCLALSADETASNTPLLIWGGNTTVGYFAIQIAKLHNIEVATTCSPKSFDKMRQAGATHVFDYNDEEVTSKIQSALPNLQHVFDTVGNETSSATAARSINQPEGLLCTVRPGKANTQDVPSHIKVTDVFVFTAFPTEHSYRGKAHWPVKMNDHKLSAGFHGQLETLLGNRSLKPSPIRLMGQLSPSTVEKAMDLNRQGSISGEKLVFKGFT
ncbi:ToxD-like protein [Fusarium denticulatum]|uniref:ToxD-like protein n=1 Tax=Fusarium denticulatum TaxID=48507 RepID=A0A8H5X897_9HYPO|nr:ToxD-like protein [Fusarium denticulatum]